MNKHILLLFLMAGCLLSDCSTPQNSDPKASAGAPHALTLTLLHINDHHSHLDAEQVPMQLDTGAARGPVLVSLGGFPRVTAAMHALKKNDPNPITIHSGDAITGDLYYTITHGKADAALMNTVCFDSFTLGNHEFDNGDAGVKTLIDFLHQDAGCTTPVLSANVRFGASSPLRDAPPREAVLPYTVVTREGEKIAIIGLTTAFKTKHSSRPNPDTEFLDEAQTAQQVIDQLQARGINKIILATHIGYGMDQVVAKKLHGVDVIVGGDSHTLLGPDALTRYGLTPLGPYPTRTTDSDGNPVCIVQAWQYADVVGELRVDFDDKGVVRQCTGTPWVLMGDQFAHADKSPLNARELAAVRADVAKSQVLRITPPDSAATAVLAPYKQQKEAMGTRVVATASENLCLRRVPGSSSKLFCSSLGDTCNRNPRVIKHGGDVQQLVAEALLQQGKTFFGADLSLQNAGAVRMDLEQGPLTVEAIYKLLPFKNTLVELNAKGQEIKDALEDALAGVLGPNLGTGGYPYAAGLRWRIDVRQPKGKRFSHLEVRGANGHYRPLRLKKTYNVATISFLADGGDSYTTLKQITGPRRIDLHMDTTEAFLHYIDSLPGADNILKPLPENDYSTVHLQGR